MMAEEKDGRSASTTKEVITWKGQVAGSSYIAERVSPMTWGVDVAGCG